MNEIVINGIKVSACHGVLESEKQTPQLFVFDVAISCDITSAAASDNLCDTVNYADMASFVAAYCKGNSFNLIEKLAYNIAYEVVKSNGTITAAEVSVHKPQAPVPVPFGDIIVTARAERNRVILSLGSSIGDGEKTLLSAIDMLKGVEGLNVLKVSSFVRSEPYGGVAKNAFTNCAVAADCLLTPKRLLNELHKIENSLGRKRQERWGDRTADIDIVFFGDKVIEEEGLCIPHPDFANRPFVVDPVKEIAPDFVCPLLHKRMSDL